MNEQETIETCLDCGSEMILVCSGLERMAKEGDAGKCPVGTEHEPQGRAWQQRIKELEATVRQKDQQIKAQAQTIRLQHKTEDKPFDTLLSKEHMAALSMLIKQE